MPSKPAYKRILLKLSGEALMGRLDYGISPDVMKDGGTQWQKTYVEPPLHPGAGH